MKAFPLECFLKIPPDDFAKLGSSEVQYCEWFKRQQDWRTWSSSHGKSKLPRLPSVPKGADSSGMPMDEEWQLSDMADT